MMKYKIFLLDFINPVFWVSFICLIITFLVFEIYNLPLNSVNEAKGIMLFIYLISGFILVKTQYILFSKFKEKFEIKKIFIEVLLSTKDFIIQIIPFFIFLYIYDSIHDITRYANPNNYDQLLINIDRLLLFNNDIAIIFEKLINPFLTSWLSFAYISYFIFYFINPIIYFIFQKRRIFETLLLTIMLTNFLGLVGYVLVPCDGPLIAQKDILTKELILMDGTDYFTPDTLTMDYLIENGALHCFPSLHFGITFVWLYFAWKYLRKNKYLKYLYYLHIPLILSLWVSTLYLRWHYLIDLFGGLIVALIGIYLAPRIINWWHKLKERL